MTANALFWDRIAEKYAKTKIPDEASYAQTLDLVRAQLQPRDTVLELGCGTGTTALKLAGSAARYTATDISGAMVRIGEAKAEEAQVKNLRFQTAAPGDKSLSADTPFDVVLAFNLLHLIEDLPTALDEIAKLVKPGGLFISKTFCRPGRGEGNLEYWMTRAALPLMQMVGKAPFVGFMSVPELEAQIEAAGFRIEEVGNYPARPPRRYIVARLPER